MSTKSKRNILSQLHVWAALGILLPVLGVGLLGHVLSGPMAGWAQQLGDMGREPLHPVRCELSSLLDELRQALREGSLASQRYLREMVRQVAAAGSFDDLQLLVAQEHNPGILEVLAQAVVARSHRVGHAGDMVELHPLLVRLATETDPALRAAVIRPLGQTIEPVSGLYAKLIQDPALEIREAVVANILAEQTIGYGHILEIAERAIAVAVAARFVDPQASARILENVDIRTADAASVNQVLDLLQTDNSRLRRGAATALGTVGAANARRVTQALGARYGAEPDRGVQKSVLQAIVRIGLADAIPILESLRRIDSGLDIEIDLWFEALELNRQEWRTLLREKERLAMARGV